MGAFIGKAYSDDINILTFISFFKKKKKEKEKPHYPLPIKTPVIKEKMSLSVS